MDRIDAMRVFVTALDEGSLAGAARRLNRSPAAVSRAIVLLEDRVGVPLLHRTTRSIALSEAGEATPTRAGASFPSSTPPTAPFPARGLVLVGCCP